MKCGKFIAGYLTFISPKQNESREKIIFFFMCCFLYVPFSITIFSAISLNLSIIRFQYFLQSGYGEVCVNMYIATHHSVLLQNQS